MKQQAAEEEHYQHVIFADEARERILEGASVLAKAVSSTMGPSGKSVIIDTMHSAPIITKDGVTVAKSINLKDRLPSMGAELLKEVAGKTNDLAGDGTTTATVLAYSLLSEGNKMISSGRSAISLKMGMEMAGKSVLQFLKENKTPINSKKDIVSVATISSNGDTEIGELIADAIEAVGADGLITIEPAKSVKTSLRLAEGIQINSGFNSPFFVTNNDKQTCELENPYVLITANKISSLSEILPVLEQIDKASRPLLIVADDVEGEALHTLVVNKTQGIIKVCVVKAPSYGEHRAELLADLGIVVNGTVLGATSELSIKKVKLENLGQCKKAIINRNSCTIMVDERNQPVKNAVKERAESIRAALQEDHTLDEFRISKFRERLAKLSGGIAVIQVGGSTEVEILEKKDRVEDAVNATQAAAQEGIVPGGGMALFYASQHLKQQVRTGLFENIDTFNFDEDVLAGINLVATVCEAPFKTIVENAGISSQVVSNRLLENWSGFKKIFVDTANVNHEDVTDLIKQIQNRNENPLTPDAQVFKEKLQYGYNVATGNYGNLVDLGIIDPVKVTRHALEHAISVIGLTLTCDAVIVSNYD